MGELLVLWAALGLLAYGGFCATVAVRGIIAEAPWELRVVWNTGRALIAVASVALLMTLSKGLLVLAQWVIR